MKTKQLFLLVLAIVASIGTIFASDTSVNSIWYNFDSSTLTAAVTFRGAMDDSYSNEYTGAVTIPSSVPYRGKIYSVTSIGGEAFYGCIGLTSVTIPNSVTSIGNFAFGGCSGLTSVTIPNSVTSIGEGAFRGCTGLTSIEIPGSVTSIGEDAFDGCTGLASIVWEAKNCNDFSFSSLVSNNTSTQITTFVFGEEVKYIPAYLCAGMSQLSNITIPNSVIRIGHGAFMDCTGLTSVIIPNSVTTIGKSAFVSCENLRSVTIPSSVTSIGEYAFDGCRGLTSPVYNAHVFAYMTKSYSGAYSIPEGIESIAGGAFRGCTGLTSVTIPNSVTSIGEAAFKGCKGLTSVIIPNSVTSIGDYAFDNCESLTSVIIPNSVTSIGENAFDGCRGLTSPVYNAHVFAYMTKSYSGAYSIPEGIESIAGGAFWGCKGLTSVTIPNSVTSIGNFAFYGCTGLTSVTIPNSVTSIGENAFDGYSKLPIINGVMYADKYLVGLVGEKTDDWDWNHMRSKYSKCVIRPETRWINRSAFHKCDFVKSVSIPSSVVYIPDDAFRDIEPPIVDNLQYAGNVFLIRASGDLPTYTIKQGTKWIGAFAFINHQKLSSITIPNSVIRIGHDAFRGCTGLTSVTIPNSVTSIGEAAFKGCTGLNSVTIPNSVTSIGEAAFKGCTGITSITIPQSVIEIGKDAFPVNVKIIYQMAHEAHVFSIDTTQGVVLMEVKNSRNINISALPYYGYHFAKWSDGNTINPRELTLTQDTTIIAEFEIDRSGSCGENDQLYWEYDKPAKTLTIFGNGKLTQNVHFGIEAMDEMETLVLQDGITAIGTGAFKNAKTLNTVYLPTTAPAIGQNVFPQNVSLYIPCKANTSDYRSSKKGWRNYTVAHKPLPYFIAGVSNDTEMGNVQTPKTFCDDPQVNALPNLGYHFVQWSDGSTDNPHLITELTQDTTFIAEFAISRSGTCGRGNSLRWKYDKDSKTLTISGNGALNANLFLGLEACKEMEHLIIGDGVIDEISDKVFVDCTTLQTITNFAQVPQLIHENTFNSSAYSSVILYLPKKIKGDYKKAEVWKNFKKVKSIKE